MRTRDEVHEADALVIERDEPGHDALAGVEVVRVVIGFVAESLVLRHCDVRSHCISVLFGSDSPSDCAS